MKKPLIFFIILVIIFPCAGCKGGYGQSGIRRNMVSSIHIRCESCETELLRYYTDPRKMRLILLCIRKLGPDFPTAVDGSALTGKLLQLQLVCTDGSTITYRIRNNQYLQKNNGHWRQLNADSIAGFYQLILQLPTDPPPMRLRDFPLAYPVEKR